MKIRITQQKYLTGPRIAILLNRIIEFIPIECVWMSESIFFIFQIQALFPLVRTDLQVPPWILVKLANDDVKMQWKEIKH